MGQDAILGKIKMPNPKLGISPIATVDSYLLYAFSVTVVLGCAFAYFFVTYRPVLALRLLVLVAGFDLGIMPPCPFGRSRMS